MAADNAFALNEATGVTTGDESRQRKLKALGSLRGLFNEPSAPEDTLSPGQPLYGGEISKDTGTSEGNEPSALATERVGRAPAMQEASPLLGPEQRLGNIATGEEGHYGPLGEVQRTVSLKDFFQPTSRGEDPGQPVTGGGEISRNVGGGGTTQNTGLALSAAKTANKVGTRVAQAFSTPTPNESISAPAGIFNGVMPTGPVSTEIGGGLETITAPQGIFKGVPPSGPVDTEGLGGLGDLIGPIGAGVGGALSIASLINSLAGGQLDTSKTGAIPNTAINAAISTLPIIQSLIGPAAGAGLGLSGIGLAATPMLIPAIEGLIKMFQEPNFPEVAGQKTHGLSDYQSAMRGQALAPLVEDYINQNANNPQALLSLAMNQNVNPQGEVTFTGSPIQGLAQNPTDEAMRQFIASASFGSGATGRNQPNPHLTDTYRRTLAHSLGMTPEQTQGLFGADPYGGFGSLFEQMLAPNNPFHSGPSPIGGAPSLQDLMGAIPSMTEESYGNFGGYSPYYRDPSQGRLSPEQAANYQALIQQILAYNEQQAPRLQAEAQAAANSNGGD